MARRLWQGICGVFHAVGLVANFVLLALFYFLIFGPFALAARAMRRDLLGLKGPERDTFWTKRQPEQTSLERARRQS